MTPSTTKMFYNKYTDVFMKYFGDVLQTYRPDNGQKYLEYLARSIDVKNNMIILDLGCGICGPAIHFAKKMNIQIDCVNISDYQLLIAKENIEKYKLKNSINLIELDFHDLPNELLRNQYDVLLFLESLGHTDKYVEIVSNLTPSLKEGGILYIKDYFINNSSETLIYSDYLQEIKSFFNYQPLCLHKLLEELYKQDYEIDFIKKIDFEYDNNKVTRFNKELGFQYKNLNLGVWLELRLIKSKKVY